MLFDRIFRCELVLLLLAALTMGASIHDGAGLSRRADEVPAGQPSEELSPWEQKLRRELRQRYMDLDYEQTLRYEACASMLEEDGPLTLEEIKACLGYAELTMEQRHDYEVCMLMMEQRFPSYRDIPVSIMTSCIQYAKDPTFSIEDVYKESQRKEDPPPRQDEGKNFAIRIGGKLANAATQSFKRVTAKLSSSGAGGGLPGGFAGMKRVPAIP